MTFKKDGGHVQRLQSILLEGVYFHSLSQKKKKNGLDRIQFRLVFFGVFFEKKKCIISEKKQKKTNE